MGATSFVKPVNATFGGTPTNNITKGLPKLVDSICWDPDCHMTIPARMFAENGKVYMEKTCPVHGYVKDLYWSDVDLYLKAERWEFGDYYGVQNPNTTSDSCPRDCGLCQRHTNHTVFGNIDLTNRCNLTCPICFANANTSGRIYEPTKEEVVGMLRLYRAEQPVAGRVVQFSGGEPTLHPEFFDILRAAKSMGFSHVQAASNGIKLSDPVFAQQAAEAGLHTIYLQFDGLSDEVYMRTRGRALLDTKLRAVESIRRAGMRIVYVPTIAAGINEDQVGKILQFAIDNIDVSSGISYQPVALTGRISYEDRQRLRYTLPDLVRAIGEQTGYTRLDDWYPLSLVSPVSKMLTATRGVPTVHMTCHPHCSLGTYLAIESGSKRPVAITRFIDVEAFFTELDRQADRLSETRIKRVARATALMKLQKHFKRSEAPRGLDFKQFLHALDGMTDKEIGRNATEGTYKLLLVAGMHFMDAYNYELERVRRCVIHYATPGGRIIPFCAYNGGHLHRATVEREHSMSLEEYRARNNGGRQAGAH
jgi:7,8-dihydro-6-hydroxymethylpterin dimethyltransferase